MSFGSEVRAELVAHFSKSEKCRRAELAAIVLLNSRCVSRDREKGVYIYTGGRPGKEESCFTSLKKTYNIKGSINDGKTLEDVIRHLPEKRAFLRGAFIAAGMISSPEREYHLEIAAPDEKSAETVRRVMADFNIMAKITERRGRYPVYIKDSEEISDMLNIMEAHVAMMNFENVRIEREIRGSVNRRFNCDTANINKSVSAAMKQIEDIELIRNTTDFGNLDEGLAAICRIRLENPDATIAELGELLTPKLGKSGVNHRLRKISSIAEDIRKKNNSGKAENQ